MLSYTAMAVTEAEAQAYAESRGLTDWYYDAGALRRGQDYVAQRFNDSWAVAFVNDAAPDEVKFAIVEAALHELSAPGSLSAVYTPGTSKVLTEVKGIKWQVIGDAGKDGAMVPVLTAVEGLLRPLLRPLTAFPSILVV